MLNPKDIPVSVTASKVDPQRRAVLVQLGKAAYVAPATVALLSVEANATSVPPP